MFATVRTVVERVDPQALSVAQAAAVGEALRERLREREPRDRVPSLEAAARELVAMASTTEFAVDVALVWGEGAVAGVAMAFSPVAGDNLHLVQADIFVMPTVRRRGYGRQLANWLLGVARERERRLVIGGSVASIPGSEAFCAALGGNPSLPFRISELDLGAEGERLRARLAKVLREGPTRAPEYELVWIPRPYPEAVLQPLAELKSAMNAAPHGSLEIEERVYTPASLRDIDALLAANGETGWTLVAKRRSDGAYAGYTEVHYRPSNPEVLQQDDTAVSLPHRGHALGRWLKAAMLERLWRELPRLRRVRTGNASANAPMLAINEAMGFREVRATMAWQFEVEVLAERLATGS
jgi:GNAT superfamily N-acetyltransferase